MNLNKKPKVSGAKKSGKNKNWGFKSILTKKQTGGLKVYLDGIDVTPEPLSPIAYEKPEKPSTEDAEAADARTSFTKVSLSTSRFTLELHRQTIAAESVFPASYISSYGDDVVIEPIAKEFGVAEALDEDGASMPEMEPDQAAGMRKAPKKITLILKETETIFLLELPSKTVDRDTEEAALVEEENARYEYLTLGKGRNRKMVNAEVQTSSTLYKARSTEAERVKRENQECFASVWEMYDTFKEVKGAVTMKDYVEESVNITKSEKSFNSSLISYEDHEWEKMIKNEKFLEAVCVIERLLANNNFNTEQKRFRGLTHPDPFRENIEYNYKLNLLWTFVNNECYGRCVTAMSWNDVNPDVVAVGYGKFYYMDTATGLVNLWNMKNPVQPERTYRFEDPVTSLSFSKKNPNLLGIGFYNGTVKLLDVSSRTARIIGLSAQDCPSFEPIWQVIWYRGGSYYKNEEQIITACQDGRIGFHKAQDTAEMIYSQIMRIPRGEGKLKGIESLRPCHVPGIPVTRYASAFVITQHPTDTNVYYVGTSDGNIHKCSRNYYHQHTDLFLAHDGPIYNFVFSPFCNKVFLTCGDDWHVRIWAEGISEPLFELSKTMLSVQGADWSPTHSTVLANICGTEIFVWDLQRKTYLPQSITASPTSSRNTIVQFIKSGECLVVGDIDGHVHVFALEDMPFPAFFQDDLLASSIFRGLVTRPDIIKKLKKLGKLHVVS